MAQAMQQLGESEAAPGYLLLQLLSQQGWRISIIARTDGVEGIVVSATKLGHRAIIVEGPSVADVATEVVKAANQESYERLH